MELSKKSIDAIISFEVTSPEYYAKKYQNPTWPGGDSGVTVGIGYDLGMNSRQQIISDWTGFVNANYVSAMAAVAGITGLNAKAKLSNSVIRNINIPYSAAYQVFVQKTLPRFCKLALNTYPGLDKLNPDTQGAIVSLVYNRGAKLTGERRVEMAELVQLIADQDYNGIADTIEKMKRLWQGTELTGLIERRETEASLVRNSVADTAIQYNGAVSFQV